MNNEVQTFIMENEAIKILEDYDIPYPKYHVVHNSVDIKNAVEQLGYPLVMKVLSPRIIHKSEFGGVVVDIKSIDDAIGAYEKILINARSKGIDEIFGALICQQAEKGKELIVGALYDEIFGPVLMVGMGGIFVEILKDVSFRVCPVNEKEATEMIKELKSYPVLSGIRGESSIDFKELVKLLTSVSKIMIDNPEIKEIDLNPVRAYEKGLICLDIRIALIK